MTTLGPIKQPNHTTEQAALARIAFVSALVMGLAAAGIPQTANAQNLLEVCLRSGNSRYVAESAGFLAHSGRVCGAAEAFTIISKDGGAIVDGSEVYIRGRQSDRWWGIIYRPTPGWIIDHWVSPVSSQGDRATFVIDRSAPQPAGRGQAIRIGMTVKLKESLEYEANTIKKTARFGDELAWDRNEEGEEAQSFVLESTDFVSVRVLDQIDSPPIQSRTLPGSLKVTEAFAVFDDDANGVDDLFVSEGYSPANRVFVSLRPVNCLLPGTPHPYIYRRGAAFPVVAGVRSNLYLFIKIDATSGSANPTSDQYIIVYAYYNGIDAIPLGVAGGDFESLGYRHMLPVGAPPIARTSRRFTPPTPRRLGTWSGNIIAEMDHSENVCIRGAGGRATAQATRVAVEWQISEVYVDLP